MHSKTLIQANYLLDELPTHELFTLQALLSTAIRMRSDANLNTPPRPGREVVETIKTPSVTYQLELVNCGKERCKQCNGKGGKPAHGPYWYAYWSQEGKTKSKYIGKELPKQEENKPIEEQTEFTLPPVPPKKVLSGDEQHIRNLLAHRNI